MAQALAYIAKKRGPVPANVLGLRARLLSTAHGSHLSLSHTTLVLYCKIP
jgi:hypothetical protein